jgi:hypothetical protein
VAAIGISAAALFRGSHPAERHRERRASPRQRPSPSRFPRPPIRALWATTPAPDVFCWKSRCDGLARVRVSSSRLMRELRCACLRPDRTSSLRRSGAGGVTASSALLGDGHVRPAGDESTPTSRVDGHPRVRCSVRRAWAAGTELARAAVVLPLSLRRKQNFHPMEKGLPTTISSRRWIFVWPAKSLLNFDSRAWHATWIKVLHRQTLRKRRVEPTLSHRKPGPP